MKNRITVLHFVLFITMLAAVVVHFLDINSYVTATFMVLSIVLSLAVLQTWLQYIRTLVVQSNRLLNTATQDNSVFTFSGVETLQQNQEKLARKFEVSATLISQLAHPEKMDITNTLGEHDPVGKALNAIQSEMKKMKAEDTRREWIAQGLALFGEILRNKQEVKEYGYSIISQLIKYIGANQGGLFIEYKSDEGRYMDLIACYAYSRQKHVATRVSEGQGLLGQVMLEQDMIILTDIPKNYVKITSGLGEATPRHVIIIPLIFNEVFCGAIEIASFEILEQHKIEFLKKVSDNIASEVATIKNMERTQRLLEDSNALTRELQVREEQMQQNLDDLAISQKEAERRQRELKSYLYAIDNTIASAEFSMDGHFRDANEIFLKVMGYTKEELNSKYFDNIMGEDQSVVMMWENLRVGKFFSGEFKMKSKAGKEFWLTGTFNPIVIEGNIPEKIMMFAQFTTQEKEKANDLGGMVKALKSTLPVLEFNERFECKTANDIAMKLFGMSRIDLRSKTILDFIAPHYHLLWSRNTTQLLSKDFANIVIPFSIGTEMINYEASISITRNLDGGIAKVIVLLVKEAVDKVSLLAVM